MIDSEAAGFLRDLIRTAVWIGRLVWYADADIAAFLHSIVDEECRDISSPTEGTD
jgi:hypothetical protein